MLCAIYYVLYNLKKRECVSHGGVFLLITLSKLTILHGCFSRFFFKLYQMHQIAQSLVYSLCKRILNYIHKLTSPYERTLKMRILFFLKLINKHWSVITTYFLFNRLPYLYFYGFCLDGALPFRSVNEVHTSNYFFILPLPWKIS